MANTNDFIDRRCQETMTFDSGSVTSSTIDLGGTYLSGCIMPAAISGTVYTVQGGIAEATLGGVYNNSGTALTVSTSASRFVTFDPKDVRGFRYMRFISDTTESASRSITIIGVP